MRIHRRVTTFLLHAAIAFAVVGPSAAVAQPVTQHEIAILRAPQADRQDGDRFGEAVAMDSDYLVVGAPGDDERGVDAGAAYVFVRMGREWVFQAKLAPDVLRAGDAFGTAVDVHSRWVLVGAPGDDRHLNNEGLQLGIYENRGAAYLFEATGSAWPLTRRYQPKPSDFPHAGDTPPGPGDAFGSAVALDATWAAFGAPLTDSTRPDVGAVYICYLGGGDWQQFVGPADPTQTTGLAVGPGRLGQTVTLAPTLQAGQPSDGSQPGGIASFLWTGGSGVPLHWSRTGYASPPAGEPAAAFGLGTSMSGRLAGAPTTTIPGDPTGPTSGVVWMLYYYSQPLALYPSTARDSTMRFGTSVAVGGPTTAFVGSVRAGEQGPAVPIMRFDEAAYAVWTQTASLITSTVAPGNAFGASMDSDYTYVAVGSPVTTDVPGGFVALFLNDFDNDGLPDRWEEFYALDARSSQGNGGASGDKDGDGATNLAEYTAQTHPAANPAFTRYFAEGATTWQFGTWIFLANPGNTTARVQLRFLLSDGSVRSRDFGAAAMSMQYVAVHDLVDMQGAEFATTIESDQPIVADRAMWWPRDPLTLPYGAHAERAIVAPASTWYFAEGATHSGFDLFYLLQNPLGTAVSVRARYLRPSEAPLEKVYTLPPLSRTTIWVNNEMFDGPWGPAALLASTDVAAVFEAQVGSDIIAERALYRSGPTGRPFESGHESAGVTAPATDWFFAEGATGDMFDTFFLVANPNDTPAQVRATYLFDDGRTLTRDLTVAANARTNIWADVESLDGGLTFPLASAAFSTRLTVLNGQPVIAERSMWWPGPSFTTWYEAHNAFGSTETGTKWVGAYGHALFMSGAVTFYLIANPGDATADVTITPLTDSGPSARGVRTITIPPHSRATVPYTLLDVEDVHFGVIVESTGSPAAPIVVERAVYGTVGAQPWAAGSAALLTKIQ